MRCDNRACRSCACAATIALQAALLQVAPTTTKKPICAVAEMGFENSFCSATGQPATHSFAGSHHQSLFSCAFIPQVLPSNSPASTVADATSDLPHSYKS